MNGRISVIRRSACRYEGLVVTFSWRHDADCASQASGSAVLSCWRSSPGNNSSSSTELAPTHLRVPSGSKLQLDYSEGRPVLAVRLQEMFGLAETPRIAGGRVAVLLHLLSPARRPVQITQDLATFWSGSYHSVKKDMKGRYPKHPWPEIRCRHYRQRG